MRLTVEKIEIPSENPFKNDLLQRSGLATRLLNLTKNIDDNLVIAINAPWGEGKTTFVKMWQALLENEGFKSSHKAKTNI